MENRIKHIAVLGGGSWATALANLLLRSRGHIGWYMRHRDRIDEFIRCGHNPKYLTDAKFDVEKIDFTSDLNAAVMAADTLVVATPSPFLKDILERIIVDISDKKIVSAVKGIVPDSNMIVTDYFADRFGCKSNNMVVIGGPCHAEEVALQRLSYLTIGSENKDLAMEMAACLAGKRLKTSISSDVRGIEYAAVLKNVYAIAAGISSGMRMGDNFMSVLISNSIREMQRMLEAIAPIQRNICDSAYLGDLMVTAYSRFSRNHNFGAMIGKGYSVYAAKMEMPMVAEGYYGAKCMYEINSKYGVHTPILDCVYDVLYRGVNPLHAVWQVRETFN
jgi:glycerol-3-phosphate dehydrogenase (NAD(P)+)